jgi:ABC-type transporter Mla MlaB component
LAALGGNVSAVDLSGHIMGDAVEMLDALNAKLESADLIVVLCARLVRLDFLAAGALLNWVSARQAEGRHVQFKDLHRLVAVFFNVIGINEHAKVTPRTD